MTRPTLVQVIHRLEELFDGLGLDRSYGGAIAYNYYGPPRLTQDVDVLVVVPDLKAPALVDALAGAGFRHGDLDSRPVELVPVLADLRSRAHLAVFQYHGVRVEVFVPWHPFHQRVLRRSPERALNGRTIRIHSAEDLIVFKKIFDRPKDLQDIRAMLLANKGLLDLEQIRGEARGLLTEQSWRELDVMLGQPA
ncbi:MAG TPA: hypothetical protein VK348_06645 [Planctomycetota bacterium]|nr:hypothetical protein [Planctomycetota bacterium]